MPDLSEDFKRGVTTGLSQVAKWLSDSHNRAIAKFDEHPEDDPAFWDGVEYGQQWIMEVHEELARQVALRREGHAAANKAQQPPVDDFEFPRSRWGRRERGRHRS
jgi:hypothetical protein